MLLQENVEWCSLTLYYLVRFYEKKSGSTAVSATKLKEEEV